MMKLLLVVCLLALGDASFEELESRIDKGEFLKPPTHPIIVEVNFYLRQIHEIDEETMATTLQITLREKWTDQRLKSDRKNSDPSFINLNERKIWVPDTFIQNSRSVERHEFEYTNLLLRVYPDGSVLKSERITVTLDTPMDYHWFPFDTQRITMDMSTYAHTADSIKYEWKEANPIQLRAGIRRMNKFEITDVDTSLCTAATNTGTYSCLRATLNLQRKSNLGARFFTPTLLTLALSWFSFWVDRKHNPSIGIGLCLVLFIGYLFEVGFAYYISPAIEEVDYMTGLDVWSLAGLVYILLATAANLLALSLKDHGRQVDGISRILSPLFLVLFIVIYFPLYIA